MKQKSLVLAVMAVAIMAVTLVGANQVSAMGHKGLGGMDKSKMGQFKQMTEIEKQALQVKHEAVAKALEAGDYNAWVTAKKALDINCPMLDKITAENFAKYAEAHKLQKQAELIMKDLGFESHGFGMMKSNGPGKPCGMKNKVSKDI